MLNHSDFIAGFPVLAGDPGIQEIRRRRLDSLTCALELIGTPTTKPQIRITLLTLQSDLALFQQIYWLPKKIFQFLYRLPPLNGQWHSPPGPGRYVSDARESAKMSRGTHPASGTCTSRTWRVFCL